MSKVSIIIFTTFITFAATFLLTVLNIDSYVELHYEKAQKACEIANSTAYSFDRSEVTCKNGAVMNYQEVNVNKGD